MRNQNDEDAGGHASVADDAWARMADADADLDPPAAEGHGAAEEACLAAEDERIRVPLRRAATAKLKAALLTTAVHILRCGGDKLPGVTAGSIRTASRLQLLQLVVSVHRRSQDDSQMLGIAVEHALN